METLFREFLTQCLLNTFINGQLFMLMIWSNSHEEALKHYELLFQTADRYGIQFKPSKCTVFAKNIDISGHKITQEGRYPSNKGVKAILKNLSHPRNVTEVKTCLGMCEFFREYIRTCLQEYSIYAIY